MTLVGSTDAGEVTRPFQRMIQPQPRPVRMTTWIVSSREAPQVEACCDLLPNRLQPPKCYQPPMSALQVIRRNWCGRQDCSSLAALRAAIDPSRPTVIFIHGSFVPLDFLVTESSQTATYFEQGAGRPLNVIFFTWQGDGAFPACAAAVRIRERRARTNAFYLAELLKVIPPSPDADPTKPKLPTLLIAHSHGCEMVCATLELLAGGHVAGRRLPRPSSVRPRTILFAPAVDNNDLDPGQAFEHALCMTPAMAVVYSHCDYALTAYPLRRPLSPRALGKTGLRDRSRQRIGPVSNRVCDFEVSEFVGLNHVWGEYLLEPQIIGALRSYFR